MALLRFRGLILKYVAGSPTEIWNRLSTIHANGAEDALRRLAYLAMRASGGITPANAEQEARNSIHIVVHVEKIDGMRKVRELLRVRSS